MYIPEGNVVLLRDHPEGRNKIQDGYKSELFKVVKHVTNPDNVYIIVPVKGSKEQTVNRCELKDLGNVASENETGDEDSEVDTCKELGVPKYTPPVVERKKEDVQTHRYPTHSKNKLNINLMKVKEYVHPDLVGLNFS